MAYQSPRCEAPTQDGGKCQNYRDTCPHPHHRSSRKQKGGWRGKTTTTDPAAVAAAKRLTNQEQVRLSGDELNPSLESTLSPSQENQRSDAWSRPRDGGRQLPRSFVSTQAIHMEEGSLGELVAEAADHYRLDEKKVLRDMHLTRMLYVLHNVLGENMVMARPFKSVNEPAGQFVFRGGTSLVSAWNVCERYSVDLDLLFGGWWHLNRRRMRKALEQIPRRFAYAYNTPLSPESTTTTSQTTFFALDVEGLDEAVSVDVAAMPRHPPAIWIARRQVTSLAGRLADQATLQAHPFLGGFSVPTLGPGSTATDKLLAQGHAAATPTTRSIHYRARDWYDLGRIALCADRFDDHLEQNGPALLGVSEWWTALVGSGYTRPAAGFSSIPTVRKGTPEHDALAETYDLMQDEMVWGERLPLDDAIELALTLDPGPAEPYHP